MPSVIEGSRPKTGVGAALAQLLGDLAGGIAELKAQFSNNAMKVLLQSHIDQDLGPWSSE
jgi:type IV secretion system protein VirB4